MEFDPFKVNAYSIEELAAFVKSGSLTLQDIYMSGLHYSKHAELEAFLAKDDIEKKKEACDWSYAYNTHTIEGYEFYLSRWENSPFGIHSEQAKAEIEKLRSRSRGTAYKQELLADMKENSWRYRQENLKYLFNGIDLSNEDIRHYLEDEDTPEARFLLTSGRLTMEDLYDAEVVPVDIKKSDLLKIDHYMPYIPIRDLGDLPSDRTDIYTIGMPREGKSSIFAAIAYTLFKKGQATCIPHIINGKDVCLEIYNQWIRSISSKKAPASPGFGSINFIKINFEKEKKIKKITFIDVAGEAYRELSKSTEDSDLWDRLGAKQYILNNNRKILFFILDWSIISKKTTYSEEFSKEVELNTLIGLSQIVEILKNDGPDPSCPSRNCTMSKVDAIGVIMTKCDLMDTDSREGRIELAKEYLHYNALNFINSLRECCHKYNINRTNHYYPYIFAFSLGKFLVGNTVLFDGHDADEIIEFIQETASTSSNPNSIWEKMRKWFS